jgi:hypothetical protein
LFFSDFPDYLFCLGAASLGSLPLILWLKPRLSSVLIGLLFVATIAILIEFFVQGYVDLLIFLLVAAPVTEESLKFASTVKHRDPSSAYGSGIGFAISENFLYFLIFLGNPILFPLMIMRSISDPSLHSLTSRMDVGTWNKNRLGLLEGILIHACWNLFSIFISVLALIHEIFFVLIGSSIMIIVLWYLKYEEDVKYTLNVS